MLNIEELYKNEDYSFLQNDERLSNIILLGLGGSKAYGTNIEGSDTDIRGIAIGSKESVILGRDFETFVDEKTDTVVYSVIKAVKLLAECNPNVIEILGLENDQYFKISKFGKLLLDNKNIFLSKRAINTFGG